MTSVLATIFDKKPFCKKSDVRQDQKKELENVPSLQDVQTGGPQLQCPLGMFVWPTICPHVILLRFGLIFYFLLTTFLCSHNILHSLEFRFNQCH